MSYLHHCFSRFNAKLPTQSHGEVKVLFHKCMISFWERQEVKSLVDSCNKTYFLTYVGIDVFYVTIDLFFKPLLIKAPAIPTYHLLILILLILTLSFLLSSSSDRQVQIARVLQWTLLQLKGHEKNEEKKVRMICNWYNSTHQVQTHTQPRLRNTHFSL